ncbi:MAG: CoA pyrophosphatase [Gemmatimonadota bacterium]
MSDAGSSPLAQVRQQLGRALARAEPLQLEPGAFERRAAITLILRPTSAASLEALFVRRADVEGDPWSGHTALPGGHEEPGDTDLLETARRETLEETGVRLERNHYLGRLDEIPPVTRRLPSISVTPFVAWALEDTSVRLNHELSGHVWIPVRNLLDPGNRGSYERPNYAGESYPTIDFAGHTIWGLTFRVVERFLALAPSGLLGDG